MTMHGFSTLEVMISMVVLAATFSACALIPLALPASLANGERSVNEAWKLEDAMDQLLHGARLDFAATLGQHTPGMALATNGFDVLATASSTWTDVHGMPRTMTLAALASDLRRDHTPDPCGSTNPSAWVHSSLSSYAFDSHPFTSLAVSSSTLVALVSAALSATDPTVFIFDISSSTPALRSAIDLSPSTKRGSAAAALSGNYAYIASAVQPNFSTCSVSSACTQLQILDIHDPAHPQILSSLKLPTLSPPYAIGTGGQSSGQSIAYANGKVYLGLVKTGSPQGEEFNIIDVHDPAAPAWIGGYKIGRTVTGILVRGIYAYVTTDDPNQGLLILNVRDPSHIVLLASYRTQGSSIYTYAQDIGIASSTLIIGRTYAPGQPELLLLDVSTITAPALSSSIETAATSSPWNIDGVIETPEMAFVERDAAIDFWSIADPLHPLQSAPPLSLPPSTGGTALACANGVLYASSVSSTSTGYVSVIRGSL